MGSHTEATSTSKGIYAWGIANGSINPRRIGLVAETINPANLAVVSNEKYLYAFNWQTPHVEKSDTVSAYRINPVASAWASHIPVRAHSFARLIVPDGEPAGVGDPDLIALVCRLER